MDDKNRSTEQMPQSIGRYKVQESIGFGAMGAVYKAFDPLIKRTLAIKTIRLDIPRQSPVKISTPTAAASTTSRLRWSMSFQRLLGRTDSRVFRN